MGPSEAGRCSPRNRVLPLPAMAGPSLACVGHAYWFAFVWKVYYSRDV